MSNDKTKSRLLSLANEIREWLIGKYSRVLRYSLLVLAVALVSLAFFRLAVGGVKEYLTVNSAIILASSIQLFAIMNPISAIPIFLSFTSRLKNEERKKIVNTITIIVIALLFIFSLFGILILDALNISVSSFQLGGGILLMVLAIDMLGGMSRSKSVELDQAVVVPLATPLLVGPGTMTTLIVLSGTHAIINILIGSIVPATSVYLTLRSSTILVSLLGKNGVQTVSRIMAVILAAIAAQMIFSALYQWGIAK